MAGPDYAAEPEAVRSGWILIAVAAAFCAPAILLRSGLFETTVEIDTLLFGVGILGAAFLLSWGAEVAQLDISQALAIAFLAFIAVLPEYAVDLVFAWKAGNEDQIFEATGVLEKICTGEARCRELAIANMTGANRLLIGIGWSVVVLLWWKRSGEREVRLGERRRIELGFLFLATLWAFSIVIRGHISLVDMVVLLILFVGYIWHAALEECRASGAHRSTGRRRRPAEGAPAARHDPHVPLRGRGDPCGGRAVRGRAR